jgi:hypothetical protein
MVFRIVSRFGLPYCGRPRHHDIRKLLKRGISLNGASIAISRVPVMYRLLGRSPVSPKNNRRPARASAIEAALKKG